MLVLSRKCEQSLLLGDDIVVTVLGIDGDRVKLGIEAPRSVTILRHEVFEQLQASNTSAAASGVRPRMQAIAAALNGRSAQPVSGRDLVPAVEDGTSGHATEYSRL
jgi:carbon storage regulator